MLRNRPCTLAEITLANVLTAITFLIWLAPMLWVPLNSTTMVHVIMMWLTSAALYFYVVHRTMAAGH